MMLTGEITIRRDDYNERQGLTQAPLTTQDVNLAARPLHLRLRIFTWARIYIIHLGAEVLKWNAGLLKVHQEQQNNC